MKNKKVEDMLYGYYRKLNRIESMKGLLARTTIRIERLEGDLRECRFDLQNTLKAINYNNDRISPNNPTSQIEIELVKAEERTKQRLMEEKKEKYRLSNRIRNLERQTDNVEILLDILDEEQLIMIKEKYGSRKTHRQIAYLLNCDHSTISRNINKILKKLSEQLY